MDRTQYPLSVRILRAGEVYGASSLHYCATCSMAGTALVVCMTILERYSDYCKPHSVNIRATKGRYIPHLPYKAKWSTDQEYERS